MEDQSTKVFFEDEALDGNGLFAIAFALMELAQAQKATARALRDLGFADAATPFGAIEAFGMVVKEGTEAIANALSGIADRMEE